MYVNRMELERTVLETTLAISTWQIRITLRVVAILLAKKKI